MVAEIGWIGKRTARLDIVTPAGIRQAYPIHSKPKHLWWNRQAIKGLTHLVTDQGPIIGG